ncbi:MAG: tetratricopeptide repeat protein [Nocardiopsaceae bacterium]|nr:tetratricopeptide repeat protein [Nocardiopsaceae bacterium]
MTDHPLTDGTIRSGMAPPLAEAFSTRPDTMPGADAMLVPGTAMALVPGEESAVGDADGGSGTRGWPGSCGKTQFASHLAESFWRSGAVDLLAWVTATSRASVLSGYAETAMRLGLDHGGDAEATAARFLAWLADTPRSWMLVLDGLRDPASVAGLVPDGPRGRVLITAVDATAVPDERRAVAVPVPAFSMREALSYLFERLSIDPEQRGGALDLASDLGREPLALAHAAAVMNSSGMHCRDYQDYFRQQRARLQAAGAADPPAAAVTWMLSAEYAETLLPGGEAWPLLMLIALLDGNGIPGTVLTAPAVCKYLADMGGESPPDPQRAWTAVQALERAGLAAPAGLVAPGELASPAGLAAEARPAGESPVACGDESPAVWVSEPLQAAVRAVAPGESLAQAAQAAADALIEAWPPDQPHSWLASRLRSCAASLLEHAPSALLAGGCHRALLAAGDSMNDALLRGPAVSWWRDLAASCERLLQAEHPDTLLAAGRLADALLADGRAAEATAWSQRVLTGRVTVLGPDHPGTTSARVSLGRALAATGMPGEASGVLGEAAARSEQAYGPDDPGTLAISDEYAATRLAAGDPGDAVRCLKRSLDARERALGPDDPATQAARVRLADACVADGKVKDAIGHYKRVTGARERALGPDHPDTIAARAGLAAGYDAAGRMGNALAEYRRVCAACERALGADHPETLTRVAELARSYHAAGQLGDAVALLRDAITRSERALSPGDPVTMRLRQVLDGITAEMSGE